MRRSRFATSIVLAAIAIASFGFGSAAHADPVPPFTQCPAVGNDPSCELLIVFNADGSVGTFKDPALGPYDGIEDTLIGVQNNTTHTVPSVDVSSTLTAFGFDGDGLCSYPVAGCPYGSTLYEGQGMSFTNISSDLHKATIVFTGGGLPAGGHSFFSVEEHVGVSDIVSSVPCVAGVTISTSVVRPIPGHIYVNDADKGSSGDGSTIVAGTPITLSASTSNLSNTSKVTFFMDGANVGSVTTPPFQLTVPPPATAGPHLIAIQAAQLDDPSCIASSSLIFQIVRPAAKAVTRNVIQNNIPAEVHLLPGGTSAEGYSAASQSLNVVDQPLTGVNGSAGAFHDSSTIATAASPVAESDSLVQNVTFLGGLIQAKSLHAHAKAAYDTNSLSGSTSDVGSSISELTVNGTPVPVDQPNTIVTLPNGLGKLVLHEVIYGGTSTSPEITVNALHAWIDTPSVRIEVILGSAFAGANFITDQFSGPGDLLHLENDLGTHSDAGDSPDKAMPITDGLYGAGFAPHDDSDWYSFDAGQADRILLSIEPSQQINVGVGAIPMAPGGVSDVGPFPGGVVGALNSSADFKGAEVHLYDPGLHERYRTFAATGIATLIDFNADQPFTGKGRWLVEVRRPINGGVEGPDAFYTIGLARPPIVLFNDDDATANEPDDTCATAKPIADNPAALVTGTNSRLITGAFRDGDVTEAFTFTANQGQHQHILIKADELAGTAMHASLYGPSGCSATPISVGFLPDVGGQNGAGSAQLDFDRVIDTTGTYTLVLTREWNGTLYGAGNFYVLLTQRDLIDGH